MNARNSGAARSYELEVGGSAKDLGQLQHSVLTAVVEKRFQDAVAILTEYRKMKASYPQYSRRTDPLFVHAEELINAINAKKNFPNMTSLAQSKQEEINQKARENMEDLKATMRRIKGIERDMAAADARSSIWVIWSLIFSFVSILSVFVINEAFRSFGKSFTTFMESLAKLVMSLFEI
jgi:hypothetical protein